MAMEDALMGKINGGSPPPQADTMTIAKRLLGPGAADRYGDVIGARPTELRDVMRDFAIGMASKDPTKADQLKMQVAQGYAEEYRREEAAAVERQQNDRAHVNSIFRAIKQARTLPQAYRAPFLKETLMGLGIEPSPVVLKMLADDENIKTEEIITPEIEAAVQDDPTGQRENIETTLKDPAVAAEYINNQRLAASRKKETGKLILRQRKSRGLPQAKPQGVAQPTAKPKKSAGLTGIPEIDAELTGEVPMTTTSTTSTVTSGAPSDEDVAAAAERLGVALE